MKRLVVLEWEAQEDLIELYAYIAERSGERIATGYVERIQSWCDSLETFPERGVLRDDLSKGLRLAGFERRATIAFRVEERQITVFRILYGGQDVEEVFNPNA